MIIGSFAGADVNPAWVHNLRANQSAHVGVGNDSWDVTAHELSAAERDDLYPKLTALAPVFAEYQAKTPGSSRYSRCSRLVSPTDS